MDIETFLTTLYVVVDDWYKAELQDEMVKHAGAVAHLSDSEVLTIALAGRWQVGIPWCSERSLVRWMQEHGRSMFPQMIGRSAFNARVRWLWGAFIRLQQIAARLLEKATDLYECVDCVPVPAFSNGQACKEPGHWLWESTTGHGGTSGGFYIGDKLLLSVSGPAGVVSGWLLGNADIQDRWLLEAFLSCRAGQPLLHGPAPDPHAAYAQRCSPPTGHLGAFQAVGPTRSSLYLADRGFNSRRWREHWLVQYAASVLSIPSYNDAELGHWSSADRRFLASKRQPVETAFAFLSQVFGLKHLNAHSRWGQYTRLAATLAAYNIALFLNRSFGHPDHAFLTLLS
jgi:hypothetical protein